MLISDTSSPSKIDPVRRVRRYVDDEETQVSVSTFSELEDPLVLSVLPRAYTLC